jgi:hypothetical protein
MIDFQTEEFRSQVRKLADEETSKWREENKEKLDTLANLMSAACAALDVAADFCEENNLIFDSWCSPLQQPYISKGGKEALFQRILERLQKEILVSKEEIQRFEQSNPRYSIETSIENVLSWHYGGDCLFTGWQHSQIGC